MDAHFDLTWVDKGREPHSPPNPDYPDGIDLDSSGGAKLSCLVPLPYPARRCGDYIVYCRLCGLKVIATTAGRPDDPRSIKLACQRMTRA
jgi:hypothetical protein